MDGQEIIVFNHNLPSSEQQLLDVFKNVANKRNTTGSKPVQAIARWHRDDISSIAVGQRHVAFLFKDGSISRLGFRTVTCPSSPGGPRTNPPPSGTQPAQAAAPSSGSAGAFNRAKFRRLMVGGPRRDRGVIVDRSRPLIPASDVPDELIAQAQVVLQGKSREVIIRELQRTNLNVNEAVNNLLSKDDDDDENEEGAGDMCLPEELLTLLDNAQGNSLLDDGYSGEFEYLVQRGFERRRTAKEAKKQGEVTTDQVTEFDEEVLFWTGEQNKFPEGVTKFTAVTACASELLALADDGKVYSWKWEDEQGALAPHEVATRVTGGKRVASFASSQLRVVVLTADHRMASWLDPNIVKNRLGQAFEVSATQALFQDCDANNIHLFCSNQFGGFITPKGDGHWCGMYPPSERKKIFEKARNKQQKNMNTDAEIKVASEVRTKSSPIYGAGSVAVLFAGGIPKVGVLMENSWSLTEMCRFRIMDPDTYEHDRPKEHEKEKSGVLPTGSGRKRRAVSDCIESALPSREEPFPINEAIFIHEEHISDSAIVKIVDGDLCGIQYLNQMISTDFASSSSSIVNKDRECKGPNRDQIRLMRKEELVVVTQRQKNRSPCSFQKDSADFRLPLKFDNIYSVVADESSIRCLIFDDGEYAIVRVSVRGKLLSKHGVPILKKDEFDKSSLKHVNPKLLNYGEDFLLLLQVSDKSCAIPLARDSAMGFRKLAPFHLPSISHVGLSVTPFAGNEDFPKSKKNVVVVALTGPLESATKHNIPSLMKAILYADLEGVRLILNKIEELGEEDRQRVLSEQLSEFTELGGTPLHAAILLAISHNNADQADVSTPGTEDKKGAAATTRADLDARWMRMLRSSAKNPPAELSVAEGIPEKPVDNSLQPIADPKQRQINGIEIVKLLCNRSLYGDSNTFDQIMRHRDINGHTAFMSAVQFRAYSAARFIWESIMEGDDFDPYEHGGYISKMDRDVCSWPLFVLCYNDTCSFTWTGEEHINQDIFECKTCGLVGTLCCCTECAFTCHRGHDCHLKRTSPTAYCDCWEKCPCKALVAGNLDQRLWLLKELISNTDCYTKLNKNGHHILYFLANTVGRQAAEQSTYKKRRQPATTAAPDNVPEHNLDPPAFAPKALELCLQNPNVVYSLLLKDEDPFNSEKRIVDMKAVRLAQIGTDQLDMFLFVLLAKCPELYLDTLVKLLQEEEAKRFEPSFKSKEEQDIQTERTTKALTRFMRSLLRIYSLIATLSPSAASTAASGTAPMNMAPPDNKRQQYHAIAMSGFLGIVRKDPAGNRDAKKKIVCSMVLRCRRVFQQFPSYAAIEGARLASAVIAPVRLGWIRNSQLPFNGKDCEALDELERMLGFKLRPVAKESKEEKPPPAKPVKTKAPPNNTGGNESGNDEGSDSGSEDDESQGGDFPSSRRLLSLSSNNGHEEAESAMQTQRRDQRRIIAARAVAEDSDNSYSSGEEDTEMQNEDEDEMDEDGGEGNEDEEEEGNQNDELMEEDVDAFFGNLGVGDSSNDGEIPRNGDATQREADPDATVYSEPQSPDHSPPPHLRRSPSNAAPIREDISEAGEPPINEDSSTAATVRAAERENNPTEPAANREGDGETITNDAAAVEVVEEIRRRAAGRVTASASGVFTLPTERGREATYHGAIREILENKTETMPKTAQHLAEVFYILNSLVWELLQNPEMYSRNHLPGEEMRLVEAEQANIWAWCNTVMDVTEAQIKYSIECGKEMGVADPSTHFHMFAENRPRAHEYSLELLRSAGCELGDNTPLLDVAQMRPLVLITDAFLMRCRAVDNIDPLEKFKNIPKWEQFFERPRDLSFPGLCLLEAPAKRPKVEQMLPLVGQPYLLTPTSDREEMFNGLPYINATMNEWLRIYPVCMTDSPSVPPPGRFDPLNMCLSGSESITKQCTWKRKMNIAEQSNPGPSSSVEMFDQRLPLLERDRVVHLLETRVINRWRHTLRLLSKEFYMDVLNVRGWEIRSSVLLREVAGYNVRQEQFRRQVDKFSSQVNFSKDITFDKLCRDPVRLVRETIWQLNQQYTRRMNSRTRDPQEKVDGINVPSMITQKVKVSFESEPGEGSGVARSFYTALAEALMTLPALPFEDLGWNATNEEYLYGGPAPINSQPGEQRAGQMRRLQLLPRDSMRAGSSSAGRRRSSGSRRQILSLLAQPYQPRDLSAAETLQANIVPEEDNGQPIEEASTIRQHPSIADNIYIKVRELQPNAAARITGMLSDLPFTTGVMMMTASSETFKNYMNDAVELLQKSGNQEDVALLTGERKEEVREPSLAQPDPSPLFYQMSPDCPFFAPCPGRMSPIRMNAYRNIGRLIGLCISQNEVLPFRMARHVMKYVLDQPIDFYDLAFVDKELFNRLEGFLYNEENVNDLDLNYTTMIPAAEVDGKTVVEYVLKEGGHNEPVNRDNLADYVRLVVLARLHRPDVVKCMQAIKSGLYDVIPQGFLDCFTAEDFRLTMCGVHQVDITRMRHLTSFLEECKATPETVDKLKKWFWEVADNFNDRDKQDLIFFWTGCSSLPASDEAFVPCPTVVIRSLGDTYLPTANTCISRLYLPLYSSKKHLETKLRQAIEIKTFGFV